LIKLIFLFLIFICSLSELKADDSIFSIKNNEIFLDNDRDILDIRQQAKKIAFKNAFKILTEKILEPKDLVKISQIKDFEIENFVKDYQLQKEKISDVSYFSILDVNFNPEKINVFFSRLNIRTSTFISESYVLLPIMKKFNTFYLWEEDNYWYDYLKEEYDDKGLVKIFFPEKSHKNKLKISAKQIIEDNIASLSNFLEFYKKKKALIIYVEENYNYEEKLFEVILKTKIFTNNKFSEILIIDEELFKKKTKTSQLEIIAKISIKEIENWWKKQIDLINEDSNELEEIYLSFNTQKLSESLFQENKIRQILGDDNMILTEFSDGKTIFKIFTNYKIKQLNLALEPSNIKLIPIPNKKDYFTISSY